MQRDIKIEIAHIYVFAHKFQYLKSIRINIYFYVSFEHSVGYVAAFSVKSKYGYLDVFEDLKTVWITFNLSISLAYLVLSCP